MVEYPIVGLGVRAIRDDGVKCLQSRDHRVEGFALPGGLAAKRRNAADRRVPAHHREPFHQQHARARLGRRERRAYARDTAAYHGHVTLIAHRNFAPPGDLRSFYG